MMAYFLLLSVPSILSLGGAGRPKFTSLFSAFLLFAVFMGFRDRVGMDWPNYAEKHQLMHYTLLEDVLSRAEPLSNALFWISENLGPGMVLSNVVASVILLLGVFSFARRTSDPWLAIVAATPHLLVNFGMSAIRQSMAIGIIFWVLSRWEQSGIVKKAVAIGVASLFHTSALIMMPFLIFTLPIDKNVRNVAGAVGGLAGLYFVGRSDLYGGNISFYEQLYVSGEGRVDAPGAIFHVALVVFPSIFYLMNKHRLEDFVRQRSLMNLACLISISLIPMIAYSSVGASRVSMYFTFVPMAVYPAVVAAAGPRGAPLAKSAIVALHFVVLGTWLLYGNNAYAWIPFRSFLFE